MEIRRCAARKESAETVTVVSEQEPCISWTAANGCVKLQAFDTHAPLNPAAHYDYTVILSLSDIADILKVVSVEGAQEIPNELQSTFQNHTVHLLRLLECAVGNRPMPFISTPQKSWAK